MAKLLAYYGGTFDPIHYGHLKPLQMLAQQTGLQRIILLPNNQPPHRPQPQASSQQRLEMIRLAIAGNPLLALDDRELQRQRPSYTVETLQQLREQLCEKQPRPADSCRPAQLAGNDERAEYPGESQPLAFIIGMDSLHSFPAWHRPQHILACSHLIVCRRPGYDIPRQPAWLTACFTRQISELYRRPAGAIFIADTPLYPVSASDIRQRRQRHQSCADILPPQVLAYIQQQGLYC